ncbi:MAG: DUF6434 domain-containing protein [Cyanobacteria bacterium P01_A01_bin.116]
MKRPELSNIKSVDEFDRWYWLKEELVTYCKENGLQVTGNKLAVANRIRQFLKNGIRETQSTKKLKKANSKFDWHAEKLSLETKITDSYKNTQNVRRFMVSQVGPSFRFSIPLMKWMKENEGKTLKQAVEKWHQLKAEKKSGQYQSEIPPSNEYNQYVRDFMKDNPNKSLVEARQCWAYKKTRPGSNRYARKDLKESGFS